jgi:hypothetical protein
VKPFDLALYDADDNAKDQVITWLKSYGYIVDVNPDQYGIDLIGTDNTGRQIAVEVEVKHHWKGAHFPFRTVHVSARKQKFVRPDAYLVMVNHERTHCLTLDYEALSKARLVTKPTIYTTDEQFMQVDVEIAKIRKLDRG